MSNSYHTPYDDKPYSQQKGTGKRYATAAIILGGGAVVGGGALAASHSNNNQNYGKPFTYNGQQYYVPGDSKRALYPNRDACMKDVPATRQSECEPMSSYSNGYVGGWYGPVYTPRDSYQPNGQYPTETADKSNVGKKLPSGANVNGFGDNGKAFTGSKGG